MIARLNALAFVIFGSACVLKTFVDGCSCVYQGNGDVPGDYCRFDVGKYIILFVIQCVVCAYITV